MEAKPATSDLRSSDKPKSRTRKALVAAGLAFLAYGLVGAVIVPPIAKRLMASNLEEKLGRAVQVDKVSVNPYTLEASVEGLRILEPDRKSVFAQFRRLDLNGSVTSLARLAPVVDELTLEGLRVTLVRDGENHYNASDILERLAAQSKREKKDDAPARFSISNIRVADGRIEVDDRPLGTKHEISAIDLAIPFVSNLPRHLKEYVQPRLSARVNGAPIAIRGETLPFENSLRTHIALDLRELDLPRYVAYSPAPLPVKLSAGKLDGRVEVRFTHSDKAAPVIDVSGRIGARDLAADGPEGPLARVGRVEVQLASLDPLAGKGVVQSLRLADAQANAGARIGAFEAQGIRFDARAKEVRIESLATRDAAIELKRAANGSIEMPVRLPDAAGRSEAPASPWRVTVAKASLDGYRLALQDASVKPAVLHKVTLEHAEATGITTEKGAAVPVAARLTFDRGGSVDVESTVAIDPLAVDAKVDARRIDLVPLRAYVPHFETVKLKSALASARGRLQLRSLGAAMKVTYTGFAEIGRFASFDTVSKEDLLNWDSVRADAVAFKWATGEPLDLAVGDIAVKNAYSRVVVTPEGKINLQQLKFATADDPAPDPQPAEDVKPRNVRIDRITFADSRLNFTDHYIKPNYTADVGDLNGTVTNLSSDPAARGEVDLKGSYDKSSSVVIAGKINPLSGNLYVDIAAKGSDIELPRLSAYSMRYAGYPVTSGKLTIDVKYHVEDGKLEGRNKILLDQLAFGEKVESPDATTLPVLFAVNLLKDADGKIDLELPIKGSLEDPQFDIGSLISQVVGNLLKKAITAPFSLLAAAFGGGGANASGAAAAGEDLAYVAFAPGEEQLADAERAKLERISKALLNRPAVKLEMAGRADPDKDLAALKRARLRASLQPEGTTFDEARYEQALRGAYEKEYGKETKDKDAKPPTVAQMEAKLLERLQLGDQALAALAARRAEWVKTWLTAQGGLPAERVLVASAPAGEINTKVSRVDFTLK